MPTVHLRRINLYYETQGIGLPILMFQGLGLDSTAWVHQIPALSQHHQLILVDNRGVGRTDQPSTSYTTEEMAEDAIALLDALEIDQADVLGFSMGGLIAQILALHHPERVNRLLLVNTAAYLPPVTQHILQNWLQMMQDKVRPATRMRSQLPWLFTDRFFEDPQQVNELIQVSLQYPYPQTTAGFAGQLAACLTHDTRSQLQQIAAPTLVLAAAEDRLIPVVQAHKLATNIPDAQLQMVTQAGHNFLWEAPAAFNQAVLAFINP